MCSFMRVYICVHLCVYIYISSFMRVYISMCIFNATVIASSWCNAATDGPDKSTALKELLGAHVREAVKQEEEDDDSVTRLCRSTHPRILQPIFCFNQTTLTRLFFLLRNGHCSRAAATAATSTRRRSASILTHLINRIILKI